MVMLIVGGVLVKLVMSGKIKIFTTGNSTKTEAYLDPSNK
jgi:hypothetical protein